MEDYIYIIIGIIWIVFSVIKGSQKNKKIHDTDYEEDIPEKRSALEEFLEELLPPMEKKEVAYESYDDETIAELSEAIPEKYMAYSGMNWEEYNHEEDNAGHVKKQSSALITKSEDKENYEAFEDESRNYKTWEAFDLRQAVIYSTILERPYK
ncbi:MAG: hypothetical protein Q8J88_10405 [Bacteroidales bacterium]|nr:hypothetical protein [Bacteroidales bacterium]